MNSFTQDTNYPKGRKSAYIYFCSAMCAQVKEELGEEGKSLIMTELGKRCKTNSCRTS